MNGLKASASLNITFETIDFTLFYSNAQLGYIVLRTIKIFKFNQ